MMSKFFIYIDKKLERLGLINLFYEKFIFTNDEKFIFTNDEKFIFNIYLI